MRILTVGSLYPPHHLGGYELVWHSAVEHLRAAGHDVRVLTSDTRLEGVGGGDDDGVHRELRWYWHDHDFPRPTMRERLRIERHNGFVVERHLAEHEPEVVSWWGMGGMSLSLIERVRREGRAANAIVCDEWLAYGPRVDAWTRAFAGRPLAARVAEALTGVPARLELERLGPFLFLSEHLRAAAGAGFERAAVCPRGADPELFSAAPEREWDWRLLYAGRIDPRKGIDTAIEAVADLPGAYLRIDGGGDERHLRELRALARERGVSERVEFARSPRERLGQVYATADAIVFPVSWPEPWGLVPLEAMAVGRPVVATGAGGSGEYLRDGENALLFDPAAGAEGLAERVRLLAADAGLRARLRAGGLETAARYGVDEFNAAVERLCEEAEGSRP